MGLEGLFAETWGGGWGCEVWEEGGKGGSVAEGCAEHVFEVVGWFGVVGDVAGWNIGGRVVVLWGREEKKQRSKTLFLF